LIRSLKDPDLLHFWQKTDNQGKAKQEQLFAPVLSRFWHFNSRPAVRNIFGQRSSSFTMAEAIAENKIVLVNMTNVDKDTSKIVISLLVNTAWKNVRENRPERPFFLVADELQNLLHVPVDFDELLAQARSFNFPMIFANQHAAQLPERVRAAAHSNARTKIVFQQESDDAKVIARQMGTSITENDLMNLRMREALVKVSTSDGVSPPFTLLANEPVKPHGLGNAARIASRTKYGKSVAQIEREIIDWRKPKDEPDATRERRVRPKISGSDW